MAQVRRAVTSLEGLRQHMRERLRFGLYVRHKDAATLAIPFDVSDCILFPIEPGHNLESVIRQLIRTTWARFNAEDESIECFQSEYRRHVGF
jgi:hypothetical protein